MPLFFPGSSEQTIKPHVPSVVLDKLAELSTDEPLPELEAGDRIKLFAQSPRKLYLYWGLAQDPYATLRRAFGSMAERYSLVIRLINTENDKESLHLASPTKSQWIEVQPSSSYRVELGLYAPGQGFIKLLSSNTAQTPRSGVARDADQTPEWNISTENFARVLDEAGYVSDALEVTLEAADEATHDLATRSIAQSFGGADMQMMTEEDLAEMRGLLAALAFGASLDSLRPVLSQPLADWLTEADHKGFVMDGAHLFEILHTMLGIEMSSLPLDINAAEAARRVARVPLGASEVNLPARPFHLWMPSMSLGRLKMIGSLSH
jgi:hypothetical protein